MVWLGSQQLKVSWEPASNLRQSVINEYEGDEMTVHNEVDSSYAKNPIRYQVSK